MKSASVAMLASTCISDPDHRAQIRTKVERWLADLRPRHDHSELVRRLKREEGTLLEPFTLSESGRELAALFMQAAFSSEIGQKRFRVVSEETLGARGGCVFTCHLKSHYVERLGKTQRHRSRTWFLAPAGVIRPSGELKTNPADDFDAFRDMWVDFPTGKAPKLTTREWASIRSWLEGR